MSLSSLPKPATLDAILRFRQHELRAFANAYFGVGHISRLAELTGGSIVTVGTALREKDPRRKYRSLCRIEKVLRTLGFVSALDQPKFQRLAFPRLSKRDSTKVSPERQRRMGFRNATLPGPEVIVVQRLD